MIKFKRVTNGSSEIVEYAWTILDFNGREVLFDLVSEIYVGGDSPTERFRPYIKMEEDVEFIESLGINVVQTEQGYEIRDEYFTKQLRDEYATCIKM
jgi:hypothetical protein